MDFYAVLGLAPGASSADIKRAYRRLSRRYHPGHQSGGPRRRGAVPADHRGVRDPDRSGAASAVRRRRQGAGEQSRAWSRSSSPGSIFRCRPQGAQAATFTELFAEVLHPVATGGRRASRAGRRSARDADRDVPGVDDAACERQVVVTRQDVCAARAGAPAAWRPPKGAVAQCHGDRATSAGRAGTWCSPSRARRAAGPAGSGISGAARAAAHGRGGAGPRASPVQRAAGRRVDGTRLRIAGTRTRRPSRRRDRRSLRHGARRAASAVPPRGGRPASSRCRWRCTRRCSARASRCRRSTARSGSRCRRARRRGRRFRVSGRGAPTRRRADAAI